MRTITVEDLLKNTTKRRGCRIWTGTIRKKTGLPQVSLNGQKLLVTRLMWELSRGETLEHGDSVVHIHGCSSRACIAPEHLARVSRSEAWTYRKAFK